MSLSSRPEFEPIAAGEVAGRMPAGVLPWLRLMRLPNVFTAIADVAMGYLLVQRSSPDAVQFALLVAASASLYTAGMVLNDWIDVEVDRRERPFRPLPAGQVSVRAAAGLGFGLLVLGLALGWLAGYVPSGSELPWRSGLVATALAGCVLFYDGWLKSTPAGPLGMGLCRFLNVLLAMSVGPPSAQALAFYYGPGELLAAAGIGVYIVGVTWFARSEAGDSRMWQLVLARVVMAMGVVLLGMMSLYVPLRVEPQIFATLLALLSFTILRRGAAAAYDPAPETVQAAVEHSILSLIWFDAAIAIVTAGAAYGIAIAALLLPALILGRWVYST
jgi:4-hydroxybenzoate polyprenyltransferase